MKSRDIRDAEIGRLQIRRYPLSQRSLGFEIRWRFFSVSLVRLRIELVWLDKGGAK